MQGKISKAFLEEIIKRAGTALVQNQEKPSEKDENLSLVLHLMKAFGYRVGGRLTKNKLSGLHKAVSFAHLGVANGWISSELEITDLEQAQKAFGLMFSGEEAEAFEYMQ